MVLGLCGRKTIKTNEELSNILYELGATEDIKEGEYVVGLLIKASSKEFDGDIINGRFIYGGIKYGSDFRGLYKRFLVEPVKDLRNNKQYKIELRDTHTLF